MSCSEQNDNRSAGSGLVLYGNVDIREVQLAFQDSGRLARLYVDEGAAVKPGQVMAELDPVRFQLEVDRLTAEVKAQAEVLARLQNGSRPQEVEKAKAGLDSAKASLKEAQLNLDRKQLLLVSNRISQQDIDTAKARVDTLEATVRAAEGELSLVAEGPRQEDILGAQASLQALTAARELAAQRLADSRLLAPAEGVIRNRILESGAMASAGAPVFTLALTSPLWVRAFVNEPDLGRVREGMNVAIHSDSFPATTYQGWVGFISSTAEFTPKTVETSELRTKLVYRARVFACDPNHELRLGMPVTVTVDATQTQSSTHSCGN
ncbi:MAG: efflux RND transporter periplasmic adaptor subunit [Desulfobulbus sp.]|nr:efflux RND transporter periplasmic adaptor subunit [Desulfobulbus sp.]